MNNLNFISNIKSIDLTRFFIDEYGYKEIKLKNIEGIFLENRSNDFPLIRISLINNISLDEYNNQLDSLKRLSKEYDEISSLNNAKILSFYFSGEVVPNIENLHAIVLKNNDDIVNSEIIEKNFPLLKSKFNIENYNNEADISKILFNNNTSNKKVEFKEINVSELLGIKDINKNTIFTLVFIGAFIFLNMMFLFQNLGNLSLESHFAFYSIFIFNLEQYYRIFTGLFLSDSVLSTLIYAFFLYRYMSFVEIKMGTKKTIVLYILSIISVYIAMFTIARGEVMFSPYPLIVITAAAYLSIMLLPSQIKLFKLNQRNILIMLLLFISISIISINNLSVLAVGFLISFVLVKGLDLIDKKVNYKILLATFISLLLLISTNFIPSQTLYRSKDFEIAYFKYELYYNKENAIKEKEIIDNYYKKIGALYYE